MAQLDEIVGKSNIQGVLDLDKALIALDETFMKVLKSSKDTSAILNTQTASFSQLRIVQEQTTQQAQKLGEAEKQAEKIAKDQAAAVASLEKQRQKALEAAAKQEAKERELAAAIQMEVKSISDAEKQNKALLEAKKKLNLTTEEGKKKNQEYNAIINKNTEFIRANSDAATKQRMNIGNYKSALEGLPGPLGRAANGVAGLGKQLWALVANPIVAIVAAIVSAFTALYKILKSTDEGANFLDATFKAVGAIFDVIRQRVLVVVDAFKALFSGNFREAGEKFKESVSGIGDQMKAAAGEAWNLVYAMDALEDRMTANISKVAEYENRIARLRVASKDQRLSDQERMNAAKEAMDLQRELADDQVKFAEEQYQLDLRDAARKLNIKKETVEEFIRLDASQLEEAVKNNVEFQRIGNELGDEGVKKLEESYAKKIQADTGYFEGIRRQQSEYTGFIKEIENGRAEAAKLADEQRAAADEAEKERRNANAIDEIDIIKAKEFAITEVIIGEMKYRAKTQEELDANQREQDAANFQYRLEKAREYTAAAQEIGQTLLEFNQFMINSEVQKMEQAKAYELQLAGDNADKRAAIEKKYDKEASKLKAKQARQNKAVALFEGIINVAKAITAALGGGPVIGIVLAALTAAIGAIQVGIIASQPVPQFWKGTQSAPDGVISVGERGQELIQTRSGKVLMANRPTLLSGMKGARIYSNKETEAILKARNLGYDSPELRRVLNDNNEKLIKAIQNKREIHITPAKNSRVIERDGTYFRNYYRNKLG